MIGRIAKLAKALVHQAVGTKPTDDEIYTAPPELEETTSPKSDPVTPEEIAQIDAKIEKRDQLPTWGLDPDAAMRNNSIER